MAITKPALSIFTGDKSLGNVWSEQNQINVKFWEFNWPLSNTEGNTATNIPGKTRIIVVQGAHDGTEFNGGDQNEKLKDFIAEMEAWLNNDGIQSHIVYTDSFGMNYSVYCVDWMWKRSFSDPHRILWTLMIKEA